MILETICLFLFALLVIACVLILIAAAISFWTIQWYFASIVLGIVCAIYILATVILIKDALEGE